MATFSITTNAHDAYSDDTNEQLLTSSYWYMGDISGSPNDWGWIFRSTGIAPGAVVTSCTVTITQGAAGDFVGTTLAGDWWGYNVDTPANFDGAHVHRISDHHARTSASVTDNFATSETTHVSPSLNTIAQEIINRGGFSGDIGFTWRNSSANGAFWSVSDFSTSGGANVAVLTIVTGAGAAPDLIDGSLVFFG